MDVNSDRAPTGNRLLRRFKASRNANKITIDWKHFRQSALKFIITSALTVVGIGIGALLLLFIHTRAEGDISKVACQALSGIASLPLMVVSQLLLVQAGLLVLLFLIWLPKTGKQGLLREIVKGSYKGMADFSIQLPLAVGGVGVATTIYFNSIPSVLWMFPLCLLLSSAQKLTFSIIFYGGKSEQTIGWKWTAFLIASAALALFAYLTINLDWQPYLYTPPLCN
ncbi:hypothetical protein [Stenotrophomonas indicatrix]|uniref:hypothetical protein n=1 Tax=Stenotrophomonas indicatrix TaxID=2045451 RepID=UPI000FD6CE9A|nr:hypothetical protein [Stenotrophomonas indicatrix]